MFYSRVERRLEVVKRVEGFEAENQRGSMVIATRDALTTKAAHVYLST